MPRASSPQTEARPNPQVASPRPFAVLISDSAAKPAAPSEEPEPVVKAATFSALISESVPKGAQPVRQIEVLDEATNPTSVVQARRGSEVEDSRQANDSRQVSAPTPPPLPPTRKTAHPSNLVEPTFPPTPVTRGSTLQVKVTESTSNRRNWVVGTIAILWLLATPFAGHLMYRNAQFPDFNPIGIFMMTVVAGLAATFAAIFIKQDYFGSERQADAKPEAQAETSVDSNPADASARPASKFVRTEAPPNATSNNTQPPVKTLPVKAAESTVPQPATPARPIPDTSNRVGTPMGTPAATATEPQKETRKRSTKTLAGAALIAGSSIYLFASGSCNPAGSRYEKGKELLRKGEFGSAVSTFDEVVAGWPASPEARQSLAVLEVALPLKARSDAANGHYLAATETLIRLRQMSPEAEEATRKDDPRLDLAIKFVEVTRSSDESALVRALDLRERSLGSAGTDRFSKDVAAWACQVVPHIPPFSICVSDVGVREGVDLTAFASTVKRRRNACNVVFRTKGLCADPVAGAITRADISLRQLVGQWHDLAANEVRAQMAEAVQLAAICKENEEAADAIMRRNLGALMANDPYALAAIINERRPYEQAALPARRRLDEIRERASDAWPPDEAQKMRDFKGCR